jgi:hypothetical protein
LKPAALVLRDSNNPNLVANDAHRFLLFDFASRYGFIAAMHTGCMAARPAMPQ